MASPLLLIAPGAGYLVAGVLILLRQLTRREALGRVAFALIWVSLAAHALLLGLRVYRMPAAPFTGAREFSILLALLLVIAYLLTARWLRGVGISGVVLALAGLALVIAAPLLPARPQPAPPVLMSPWLLLHVPLCLLAYLMFVMAGSGAAMYLVVSNLLKRRRPIAISRSLPTLESLERFSHHMAELGFPLLTAGIMAGMVWSYQAWGQLLPETPKPIIALVGWGVYAAYFHARLVQGRRGRTCAWLLLAGLLVVVTGLAVTGVSGGPHSFV